MKKILNIGLILFLMYASLTGQYLQEVPNTSLKEANEIAFWNVVIITVIMMVVPFVFMIINKGKMPNDKGKMVCKWNSIILFIISIILMAIKDMGFVGGFGAWLYYFVNKWLYVDENKEEKKDMSSETVNKYDSRKDTANNGFQTKIKQNNIISEKTSSKISKIINNKIVCGNCDTKNKINKEYCYMCGSYLNVAGRTFKEIEETKFAINNGQAISIFNNSMKIAQELELFFQSNKHFKNIIANTEYFAMITLFTCTYFYCGLLKKQKNSSKGINDIAEYVINEINNRLYAPDIESTKKIYNKIINALEDIGNKKIDNNVNPIYGATIYYLQEVTHYNFDNKECTDIEYANILNTVSSKFIEILKS